MSEQYLSSNDTEGVMTPPIESRITELYPMHSGAEIAELLGIGLRTVYKTAGRLGLKKSREWIAERARRRMADPAHPARTHQIKPGTAPWNKGIHFFSGGRSPETQFKPGNKPNTWHPVGHERITDEGYLQRKLTETGVTRRDYVNVHWIVWRAAGRDIPPGHALIFRDGNKRNVALDNLELVTRAELMRRNSLHRFPEELVRVVRLRGALNRHINKRTTQEKTA